MKYQIQNAFGPTMKYSQGLFDSYEAAETHIKNIECFDPEDEIDGFMDRHQLDIVEVEEEATA